MSDFDQSKVLAYVNEKWGGRGCPVCGKGPWSLSDKVFQLTEFHGGNIVIGGSLVPIVPVTCNNCGNTVMVNAIICGAVKPQEPPAAAKPSPDSPQKTGTEAK